MSIKPSRALKADIECWKEQRPEIVVAKKQMAAVESAVTLHEAESRAQIECNAQKITRLERENKPLKQRLGTIGQGAGGGGRRRFCFSSPPRPIFSTGTSLVVTVS